MKPLKESNTITIKRSQINLNPYNPKRHPEEKVKLQKQNLQKVGFLGGIVWNRKTGNLIDGHRRIQAMDKYYKYDGSESKDYQVKVEAVDLSDKDEKEQMTYMALGNTKADYSLVAEYINDIDYSSIGLSGDDLSAILSISGTAYEEAPKIKSMDEIFLDEPKSREAPNKADADYQDRKATVKQAKEVAKEKAYQRQLDEEAYLTLSFSSFDTKSVLCEILGLDPHETKYIKGESVLELIQ